LQSPSRGRVVCSSASEALVAPPPNRLVGASVRLAISLVVVCVGPPGFAAGWSVLAVFSCDSSCCLRRFV
jgi:hypothetical protein